MADTISESKKRPDIEAMLRCAKCPYTEVDFRYHDALEWAVCVEADRDAARADLSEAWEQARGLAQSHGIRTDDEEMLLSQFIAAIGCAARAERDRERALAKELAQVLEKAWELLGWTRVFLKCEQLPDTQAQPMSLDILEETIAVVRAVRGRPDVATLLTEEQS